MPGERLVLDHICRGLLGIDAIDSSPSPEASVTLEDRHGLVPTRDVANDVSPGLGIMTMVDQLPAKRRDRPLGSATVAAGGEINGYTAFDVSGGVGADQLNGEDRRVYVRSSLRVQDRYLYCW